MLGTAREVRMNLWTLMDRRANVGRPSGTFMYLFCADAGCILDDLPGVMDDRDEWLERKREREKIW